MTEPQTIMGRPVVEVDMSEEIGKLGPLTLTPLTPEIVERAVKGMFDLKPKPPNHKSLIAKPVKTKAVIKGDTEEGSK